MCVYFCLRVANLSLVGKRKNEKMKAKNQRQNYAIKGVEWVHGLFLFPLVLGKM